jgi:DNA-binding NtrC family response regulator
MFHSRRAVSRTHLEGALLALVEMLLRRGDRSKAAAILERSAPASPGRHRFLREALGLRSRGLTGDLSGLLAILDRAEESGHLLDGLRAANEGVADPAWNEGPPAALQARRELLSGKFFRRCHARERAFLRRIPGASAPPDAREVRPAPVAESPRPAPQRDGESPAYRGIAVDPLLGLAGRWAGGAALETEGELERLRTALSVRGLWVLNDPQMKEPMFYGCGDGGPPLDLFSARSTIIQNVRRAGGTLQGPGFAVAAIPGDSGREGGLPRVLYLEWGSPDSSGILPARLELAAGILGCFLRVQSAEASRRADRLRLRESSREIHRLNALIARGKVEVETALITQRLGLVEERKTRDAERFAAGPVEPVSESRVMRELLKKLRKVAAEDLPVLLIGEHGVGKGLLARSIHWASRRRSGPFVSEVCAVPESLLESELFGFVRGAFTDAVEDRPGLLQLCHGGTLYLDEISEMSPGLQARLLRVIEERRARPLGAETPVDLDFRLVSSTRARLGELERNGTLRQDLYYRIRGEVLEVPPLRDRREDIPALVRAFAAASAREEGLPAPEIAPTVLKRLAKLEWPGNVRQLENAVRRAFLLDPRRLTMESLAETQDRNERGVTRSGEGATPHGTALVPLRTARLGLEKDLVLRALTLNAGNASRAARALRITRRYLGVLMEKHGIRLADFLDPPKGGRSRPGGRGSPAPRHS